MRTPKVSVIIPAYNAAATLPRAIDSVLRQRWPDTEIIVVDDGSTDHTVDGIRASFPEVQCLRQVNGGSALARNRGIEAATGEYLAFLDADDEWLAGKLERQIEVLERDRRISLCSTGALVVDASGTVVDVISSRYCGDVLRPMLRFNPIVCSSVVMRRSLWLSSGLRFEGSPSAMEDYSLWLKLAARCRFFISPRLLVRYYVSPTNKTSVRTVDLHRAHLCGAYEDALRDDVFRRRLLAERIRTDTSVRLSVAREYMVRGRPKAARKEVMTSLVKDWRAVTYRMFWNTLLWSGSLRSALKKMRRRVAVRVLAC